ncbi:MAG: 3-hydroxybutyryl-CoA dehydrogenase, partial [Candidatus Dadabacteria bacterium]|nr:3-hydroxybutyryl-CoA dehydrogenase [Candidatus Dadabacteria bacterium]
MGKKIKTVGIVGGGTMGSGIAQLVAASRYKVVLIDLSDELIKKSLSKINKNLSRLVDKEKIEKEVHQEILLRINTSTNLDDLSDCELVIEAVSENANIKKQLFEKLDAILNKDCIIASNTSTLPII